ncbi:hypothetical protein M758_6G024600 [Ceratodon purpureus]|nr:hypothetical protein M758_6G024600 [Ceratodon purpureus]
MGVFQSTLAIRRRVNNRKRFGGVDLPLSLTCVGQSFLMELEIFSQNKDQQTASCLFSPRVHKDI